jgi:glucose-6-phosphate isomerase
MKSDSFSDKVEGSLAELERDEIVARIWRRDYTVWKPQPAEISNRLGWLDVASLMSDQVLALRYFSQSIIQAGIKNVVLLGMGGSSLGPEVLRQTFGKAEGYPELIVLDSTLPENISRVRDSIDPGQTLFIVSSKSGSTLEPLILYTYFKELVESMKGKGKSADNFIAITDAETPLAKLGQKEGFRRIFSNPSDIGGRYSVLSYFGLVPAALAGIDILGLLLRAEMMRQSCFASAPIRKNPGAQLGAYLGALAKSGKDKLTLVTSPSIASFGLWAEQLLAESTGKEGSGIVPIANEPLAAAAHYGDDRQFVYLRMKGDENSELDKAMEQIRLSDQPLLKIEMTDKYDLGAEFFRWEFAAAVAGAILGVQPFDQPDVQKAKEASERVLAEYSQKGRWPAVAIADDLESILSGDLKGKYLAILAYVPQTEETDQLISVLRRELIEKYGLATTAGYGPRYLHSTGQLHKGGPHSGLFLEITISHERDIAIPGRQYTFGSVAEAQTLGDFEALKSLGRKVARVCSESGSAAAIKDIIGQLK